MNKIKLNPPETAPRDGRIFVGVFKMFKTPIFWSKENLDFSTQEGVIYEKN